MYKEGQQAAGEARVSRAKLRQCFDEFVRRSGSPPRRNNLRFTTFLVHSFSRSRSFTHHRKRHDESAGRSEPRAQLGLEDRGRVGSAHHSEMVQEVGHRGRLVVFRFPQIQDVLRGTGLGREVVDVPASRGECRVFHVVEKKMLRRWRNTRRKFVRWTIPARYTRAIVRPETIIYS